ncbi:MAG: Uncharacterized protein XD60_1506 [Acetothermia bacterium 64_32]|nr:MAG: Uncharacterized protein XD60_1506 [Acetothermia bacterium 64_32]MBC7343888.1 TIGR04076 family protein [Clostridia bacterium]HAF70303.1 TIGR04076 family protein [Candidatus Acetothermia bacterium]
MKPQDLLVEVIKVKGTCPVYRVGSRFWIKEGFRLVTEIPLCMHSLLSLAPYYVALSRGIDPRDLGLSKDKSLAYVQCLDPCELTQGGTVTFAIRVVKDAVEDR